MRHEKSQVRLKSSVAGNALLAWNLLILYNGPSVTSRDTPYTPFETLLTFRAFPRLRFSNFPSAIKCYVTANREREKHTTSQRTSPYATSYSDDVDEAYGEKALKSHASRRLRAGLLYRPLVISVIARGRSRDRFRNAQSSRQRHRLPETTARPACRATTRFN